MLQTVRARSPAGELGRRLARRNLHDSGSPEGPVFGPEEIEVLSAALDDVCKAVNIKDNDTARELVAMRIIELAQKGERSRTMLRDRLLAETNSGTGC